MSPLAALAAPLCAPGAMAPHCPMMAAVAAERPPCHGPADPVDEIQADDCCPEIGALEPAAGVPAAGVPPVDLGAGVVASRWPAAVAPSKSGAASPTPLYRLFRALLI